MAKKAKQAIHQSARHRSLAHQPKAERRPNVALPEGVTVDEKGVATYTPPEGDDGGEAEVVSPKAKEKKTKQQKKTAKHYEKPMTLGSFDKK